MNHFLWQTLLHLLVLFFVSITNCVFYYISRKQKYETKSVSLECNCVILTELWADNLPDINSSRLNSNDKVALIS